MLRRLFKIDGIMAWVTITGALLIVLSIIVIVFLESRIVDQAGAEDRQAGFLRAAEFVGSMLGKTRGIRDLTVMEELSKQVRELQPEIKRLSVFEITSESSSLVFSTDPKAVPRVLDLQEKTEVEAGRSVMQLDDSSEERAWRITAPITVDGQVVGALRGLYSIKKFDALKQEIGLTKVVGLGVGLMTSLAFLLLVRFRIHRPVYQILSAMRKVEEGDLSIQAPVTGPTEIQEVASQFNRMLIRVREEGIEKDHLLGEVQHFNETLQKRVADATEKLQQANLELVEARIAIERSQRLAALGELSATVAHELGNPLNALSGHLQMLSHSDDFSRRQRHLSIIQSEVNRMVTIIRQVLNQTRLPLRSTPLNLNNTIHEVLLLLSPGMTRRHLTLKTDLQDELPLVTGDPNALHGLVSNLVSNAKQAMPSGGELTIRTSVANGTELPGTVIVSDGAHVNDIAVRLTIADTGNGIPPEHLSRIFEPFFTTRHEQGGTGLGLTICHRVVIDSGGRLSVKSAVGQGTEVTVDLPIWKEGRVEDVTEWLAFNPRRR